MQSETIGLDGGIERHRLHLSFQRGCLASHQSQVSDLPLEGFSALLKLWKLFLPAESNLNIEWSRFSFSCRYWQVCVDYEIEPFMSKCLIHRCQMRWDARRKGRSSRLGWTGARRHHRFGRLATAELVAATASLRSTSIRSTTTYMYAG